jgi:hypothetical protein
MSKYTKFEDGHFLTLVPSPLINFGMANRVKDMVCDWAQDQRGLDIFVNEIGGI